VDQHHINKEMNTVSAVFPLFSPAPVCMWSDNKVHELIAIKALHTTLMNITVVAFKVLALESYAPMPAPSPPFKTILELFLFFIFCVCVCVEWSSELPPNYS
jgi:hypothetical protein